MTTILYEKDLTIMTPNQVLNKVIAHELHNAIFGEWVSGGEESSESSSDESNKKFTTCMGSSSNTCFMAKGMDSNVSDDDSESPSIDELLDLVHEHQKVIKKQSKEIKNLNALNDLNASLATNFKDLMYKLKLISKEYEELKLKF